MSYQDREFEIREIQEGSKIIAHFLDNCMKKFTLLDLEEVRDRHKMYADQFAFWLKQDNTKRLMIDTREFVEWLCNKIADVSEKNVDINE
tara:strand:+ start:1837 stop:2106 length:270 start_codon:yes stop_codon:yes gene_type:complete